jgi:hypothetical protein
MKYFKIEEALVYHSVAREYSPMEGNEILMREIKDIATFHPCWVLCPHHTGLMSDAKTIISMMISRGVKAARLFPMNYDFSLVEWICGDLLSLLEEHRIPVFINIEETNWKEIYEVCNLHPYLPLIITEVGAQPQYIYPLFERFDNLYLEISCYLINRGIEDISQRFGAKRLIFGSGMPVRDPGSVLTTVRYSDVSEKGKNLIAGGNLRQLLESVR